MKTAFMIEIFRIQDVDGRGPWKPGFSNKWVISRDDIENLIPWPVQFDAPKILHQIVKSKMHSGCACRSIDQLRRWFTPAEYETLRKYGYEAVRMHADRILAESTIQLVFLRDMPLNEGGKVIDLY
jgi:hypothetical protein